jgi:methyl-accepting chemotaxis protein
MTTYQKTTWFNLLGQIDTLLSNQRAILAQGEKIMSELADAVAEITQVVTDNDAAVQTEIAALILALAGTNNPEAHAAAQNLAALSAKLRADIDQMKSSLPPSP